jgi:phosphoglucomutase
MIAMTIHLLAGKPPPKDLLIDADHLGREYYTRKPDFTDRAQRVNFGTSGHRGSSLRGSFNEWHVLAITQAICDYRSSQGINGPLYIGKDTHALSEPAFTTALEVLAANGVETIIDSNAGYTPTPAVSHAILTFNLGRTTGLADGIVVTPSHNPPQDGGFKYNPPSGGPADTAVTRWIEDRANRLISSDLRAVARMAYNEARRAVTTHAHDYIGTYVADLGSVVDMEVIAGAQLKIGVDPLGGVLEPDRRAVRTSCGGRERQSGSDVPLHAAGLGRPDSHGLFVTLRHGRADRAQRPLRYRLWQ